MWWGEGGFVSENVQMDGGERAPANTSHARQHVAGPGPSAGHQLLPIFPHSLLRPPVPQAV